MCEIYPVKWHGIPQPSNGDVVVGNGQRWGVISRKKALGLFGRREAPHLLFTEPCRLVGMFRSIMQAFVLPVLHARQDLTFDGAIALQFIGDDHAGTYCSPLSSLRKKRFAACVLRRLWTRISSTLP